MDQFRLSRFCKLRIASRASDNDFPFSSGNAKPLFTVWAFEKTVVLPIAFALAIGRNPTANGTEETQKHVIFRSTPGNVSGEKAKDAK